MPTQLPAGTVISLAVTNESPTDVYVYVVSADPQGKIEGHFPQPVNRVAQALLPAGRTLDMFERRLMAIRFSELGEEIVKILASTQPIDVALLQQGAFVRRGSVGDANPLDRLLASAGQGTRSVRNQVPNRSWAAKTASFSVIAPATEQQSGE